MQVSRTKHRHPLIFYLQVHECGSGKPLGFLSDITPHGMQVLSERPLEVGRSFELRIDGRGAASVTHGVRFRARSIWSRTDVDPDYCATGFQFEEVSASAMQVIHTLIRDLGFED